MYFTCGPFLCPALNQGHPSLFLTSNILPLCPTCVLCPTKPTPPHPTSATVTSSRLNKSGPARLLFPLQPAAAVTQTNCWYSVEFFLDWWNSSDTEELSVAWLESQQAPGSGVVGSCFCSLLWQPHGLPSVLPPSLGEHQTRILLFPPFQAQPPLS